MSFDWDAHREENRRLVEEYRTNGEIPGRQLLLLTTTGAKSGRLHVVPLGYGMAGDDPIVIASKGGLPTDPAWYLNVVAHPEVMVEIGHERFEARARVAEGEERDRLFAQRAAEAPVFDEYQRKTTRVLPVIVLELSR